MKQIIIVDFGSQYTQLINSRLREEGHKPKIVSPDAPASAFTNAAGLILSGGPASVYEEGAPQLSEALAQLIFEEYLPTLGICYGMQLIAQYAAKEDYPAVESKKVTGKEVGEYGKTILEISHSIGVLEGLGKQEIVWMSHGDSVVQLPPGFQRLDPIKDHEHPENYPPITIQHNVKPIFGLQFHPEVNHTCSGRKILKNFLEICGAEQNWDALQELEYMKRKTKRQIGKKHVFAFTSGGNDSSVLARFLQKIVPEGRLHFFYVRGLGSDEDIEKIKLVGRVHVIDARRRIYKVLKGVIDPEEKRQIIGKIFVRVFKEEARKLAGALGCNVGDLILAQGTIHPDVIESGGSHHADRIKSHHNTVVQELLGAGGIIEPFSELFKPDVRNVGRILGVPEQLIAQHPSPGPGYAVRFLCADGELAPPNDKQFFEAMHCEYEMQKICRKLGYMAWTLPIKSKGVQGDQKSYCYTAGIIGPYKLDPLLELATTIPNRFKGKINRAIYLVAPDDTTSLQFVGTKKDYFRAETRKIIDAANKILIKNLRLANVYSQISQAFALVAPLSFDMQGYSVIIRAVETDDYMTASPYWLPWQLLDMIAKEIMREIPEAQAVFYDLTSKPPGTIEWE